MEKKCQFSWNGERQLLSIGENGNYTNILFLLSDWQQSKPGPYSSVWSCGKHACPPTLRAEGKTTPPQTEDHLAVSTETSPAVPSSPTTDSCSWTQRKWPDTRFLRAVVGTSKAHVHLVNWNVIHTHSGRLSGWRKEIKIKQSPDYIMSIPGFVIKRKEQVTMHIGCYFM